MSYCKDLSKEWKKIGQHKFKNWGLRVFEKSKKRSLEKAGDSWKIEGIIERREMDTEKYKSLRPFVRWVKNKGKT